jgi:surface antigen
VVVGMTMDRRGPIAVAALIGLSIMASGCGQSAPRSTPQAVDLNPAQAANPAAAPPPIAAPQTPAAPFTPPIVTRAPTKDEWAQIGRLVPKSLADSLEPMAAAALAETTARALETGPSGRAVPWAMGNVRGTVTPQPLKRTKGANQCRDMIQSVGTRSQPGTACKNGQGDWVLAPGAS